MTSAKITAVIATYNRAERLPTAIDSVLAQTHPAGEIIVVDDGSTDHTPDILQTYRDQITVITQSNLGISAARNTAIQQARGDWIAFLDDDDSWLPHKLERQLAEIQQQPEARLCHGDEIWIRNGKRVNAMNKHQKYGGWIYEYCLPRCVISPSCVMIRQDLFNTIGLFDESLPACEDYDLWLRICAQESVAYVDETLITKYGGHDDQLSSKHWGMDRFRVIALEKILRSNTLDAAQQSGTLNMLTEKLEILTNGAIKRGKQQEAKHYQQQLATALAYFKIPAEFKKTAAQTCC